MLSRTADSLFWMARYVERADFLARILDAAMRLASLPAVADAEVNEWTSALLISDVDEPFEEKHGKGADDARVREFLAFDSTNPSSIVSCLNAARRNARTVRTGLTSEVWEAVNAAWNELPRFGADTHDMQAFARFLDWVKATARAFDGAAHRTMLRNDAYWFVQLGSEIERADNTARILDVKYHLLLPEGEPVGGGLDYFQWTTILREVSASTAYRWVYRDAVKPWLVADLLILNRQMPRSLASCSAGIARRLDQMADAYGRRGPAQRLAGQTLARLTNLSIDKLFQSGLHEFIRGFVDDNARLSTILAEQYLL